jgi:hypothetical protein
LKYAEWFPIKIPITCHRFNDPQTSFGIAPMSLIDPEKAFHARSLKNLLLLVLFIALARQSLHAQELWV